MKGERWKEELQDRARIPDLRLKLAAEISEHQSLFVAIPGFNKIGDLPVGVHPVTLGECLERFGQGNERRPRVSATLVEICRLANGTGKLDRVILFGSYVTTKTEPRDIDIILVMKDDFDVEKCDASTQLLFDHSRADLQFGASVFLDSPGNVIVG
jgi:Nucleotidyltransferase domain.